MSHRATVLEVYKTKPRSLHNHPIVFVRSAAQPDSIRVVRPERMKLRWAIDENRKNNAHGFDRRVGCDKIKQLRILPIVPKIKMNIAK
jgi:hypothetical protein